MNKTYTKPRARPSAIVALCIISESEIAKLNPEMVPEFNNNETKLKLFLYTCGIDISKPILKQEMITHRNRFNEIVMCNRWVGEERIDDEWINSGYASKEAKDKASGSKILEDLYRAKYLTEDAQAMLEERDKYSTTKED